jgi:hypothetical protein
MGTTQEIDSTSQLRLTGNRFLGEMISTIRVSGIRDESGIPKTETTHHRHNRLVTYWKKVSHERKRQHAAGGGLSGEIGP